MKNIFAVALAALAISAAPALAASNKHAKKTVSDQTFMKEAAIGGMEEVELGNLAKQKASSNDVKQFGERMATDHGKADEDLKKIAQQKSIQLPTALDAKHKATVDRLSKLSGDAFDKAYMKEMLSDHKHDVAAFKKESTSAKDADVKQFASNTLPTLEDHLKLAQDTASKVGVSATAATSGHTKKSKKGSGF
jgi:putative membrane protein